MPDRPPKWTDPAMRAGNVGRGLVYLLVGALALAAAWRGGHAEGAREALESLRGAPLGLAALIVIALGLLAYALWRFLTAWYDLEDKGSDTGGLAARAGYAASGLFNLALAAYAAAVAIGLPAVLGASGGGSGTEGATGRLMAKPWGPWVIGLIGLGVLAAAVAYAGRAWTESYRRKLRATPTTERLNPVMRYGLLARALTVGLIGVFFIYAAWTYDASEAGGLAQAFETIRGWIFGRVLLGLVGLGLMSFAVFCGVMARHGVVPRAAQSPTLADEARRKAREAKAKAKAEATAR